MSRVLRIRVLQQSAFALALSCGVVSLTGALGCDPVHTDTVDALGGEASNVRPGPEHRPGQPCLVCHDGALGDPSEFSVAGTIFQTASASVAAVGATVTMNDSAGQTHTARTNQAGNFYLTPNEFSPAYPMKVSVEYNGVTAEMTSLVGRAGACGSCHADPAGPTSPGHVYALLADGGAP